MGWTNFIIVPRLKLVFEISRNDSELSFYKKDTLFNIDNDEKTFDDVLNVKISDLTVDNLVVLTYGYKKYIEY